MHYYPVQICLLFVLVRASDDVKARENVTVDCSTLRLGQYICPDPNATIEHIDPDTQQFRGCVKGKVIPSEGVAEGKCKNNSALLSAFSKRFALILT